nr:methyltransferase domain-containing protein [uncultured Dyadobacter sp.]
MAWNPQIYDQFKTERSAPFFDLLAMLERKSVSDAVDLGCGTGELTQHLATALAGANVLGVDASREMLEKSAAFVTDRLSFECISIENLLARAQQWDVVFSNAAIQWVPDHKVLFPKLIAAVRPGGQLLAQMPNQHENISNRLLHELAGLEPYATALQGWNRISPVLGIEGYAELLFENGGKSIQVFEKIYPLVLPDVDALLEWVSGTALIPYLERLGEEMHDRFVQDYKSLLLTHFAKTPVFYPFRRILIAATFE